MTNAAIINFVDFDGTIYDGDSFRDACFEIPSFSHSIFLIGLHFCVMLRLLKLEVLKRKGIEILTQYRVTDSYKDFVMKRSSKIWLPLLQEIMLYGGDTVVVTASPDFLVQDILVARKLTERLDVLGSRFENGRFIHLYGQNKKICLKAYEQSHEKVVDFIFWGDSKADLQLLPLVDKFFLCARGSVVQEIQGGR